MHDSQPATTSYRLRIWANGIEEEWSVPHDGNDASALWDEAAVTACDMIRDIKFGGIRPDLDWHFEVCDPAGTVISRFSFRAERLT
ncbi:hypothetical protein ABIC09_002977 [Bradyrhizobium sp. S3.12.5]|uniref:DUF6894 family protein n=1 Tax=Bradyrhizobium sp. S3.12.5 TaxID=3156386 RepID=UPI003395A938